MGARSASTSEDHGFYQTRGFLPGQPGRDLVLDAIAKMAGLARRRRLAKPVLDPEASSRLRRLEARCRAGGRLAARVLGNPLRTSRRQTRVTCGKPRCLRVGGGASGRSAGKRLPQASATEGRARGRQRRRASRVRLVVRKRRRGGRVTGHGRGRSTTLQHERHRGSNRFVRDRRNQGAARRRPVSTRSNRR